MYYSLINKKTGLLLEGHNFGGRAFAHFLKIMPEGEGLVGWALLELTEALHYSWVALSRNKKIIRKPFSVLSQEIIML